MTTATRRASRERALGLLYEAEVKGQTPAQVLEDLPVAPDPFVVEILTGVQARSTDIDALVAEHSIDWSVERMPVVDRNVLRMGVWELLERPEVPVGVVLSEAVALAKQYSTEGSGRFVNGVLAAVATAVR